MLIMRSQCCSTRATASGLAPLPDRGHRPPLQPRNRRSSASNGVDLGVVWIACIEVSRRGGFACMTVLEHDRNVRAAEAIGTGQPPVAGMERR